MYYVVNKRPQKVLRAPLAIRILIATNAHRIGDGRIFRNSSVPLTFKTFRSNESNFGRIHLAGPDSTFKEVEIFLLFTLLEDKCSILPQYSPSFFPLYTPLSFHSLFPFTSCFLSSPPSSDLLSCLNTLSSHLLLSFLVPI
jgi:hypothetical protein